MHIWPGQPYPLGATWDGAGVNFALFSEHASGVDLCLFDAPESPHERLRLPLTECTDDVWHGYVPALLSRSSSIIRSCVAGISGTASASQGRSAKIWHGFARMG
jgi:pullulanase/glycogen debranching enzyme